MQPIESKAPQSIFPTVKPEIIEFPNQIQKFPETNFS